jgi:tetratricopeptide (TPR) repeat protein
VAPALAPATDDEQEEPAEPAATRTIERALGDAAPPPAVVTTDEVSAPIELPQPPLRIALIGAVLVAILFTVALALVSLWRELRDAPGEQAGRLVDAAVPPMDAAVVVSVSSAADAGAHATVSVDAARAMLRTAPVDAAMATARARPRDAGAPVAAAPRDPDPRSRDAAQAAVDTAVKPATAVARPGRLDKRRLFDLLQKGDIRHEAGDYEGALEFYEKARALTDSDPRVYQKLALAYHNLGRFAESCTALGTFLRLQPHPPGEDYYRALILRNCQ